MGGTTPPTLANGVVYVAAGRLTGAFTGLASIQTFDAAGVKNCSGTPTTCSSLGIPNYTGLDCGITVVAGTVFGVGD